MQLNPPSYCDECNSLNIKLSETGKNKWPWIYLCLDCSASVGCHPGTFKPLGLMAGLKTRLLRRDAHRCFDQLWRSGLLTRDGAYRWLAEQLAIPLAICHISWLSNRQLKQTIAISNEHYLKSLHIAERRKNKRLAKVKKGREYEKQRIKLRKLRVSTF